MHSVTGKNKTTAFIPLSVEFLDTVLELLHVYLCVCVCLIRTICHPYVRLNDHYISFPPVCAESEDVLLAVLYLLVAFDSSKNVHLRCFCCFGENSNSIKGLSN